MYKKQVGVCINHKDLMFGLTSRIELCGDGGSLMYYLVFEAKDVEVTIIILVIYAREVKVCR